MQLTKDLYHYTSAESLKGIIDSQSIWATNIGFLNDDQEYKYLVDLLIPQIERLKNTTNKFLLERIIQLIKANEGGETSGAYVFSLSEEPDLLSQWRAYCKGGGFSIGFDHQRIMELANQDNMFLFKCVYIKSQQLDLIKQFIDGLSDELSKLSQPIQDKNEALRFWGEHITQQITKLANIIKHPSFHEEKEWRVVKINVSNTDQQLNHRPFKGLFIPYYSISFNHFIPIKRVIVGPHKYAKLSKRSVFEFIHSEKIKRNAHISTIFDISEIPHREF